MLCPKDNIVCDLVRLQDVDVDVCTKCQGVWIEQVEVKKLVNHLSIPDYSQVDELLKEWNVSESQGTAPVDFWKESKLICPVDRSQMQKHYFAGSNIGVDHCLVCKGFWLDGGELQAVAKYVRPNPEQDMVGRFLISVQSSETSSGTQLVEAVPIIFHVFNNPVVGIALLGRFFTNLLFDRMRP